MTRHTDARVVGVTRSGARRLIATAASVVTVSVLVAGCGLREDEDPRALASDAVPAVLAQPAPASTVPLESSVPQRIYIIETREGSEEALVPYLIPMPKSDDDDDYHRRVIEELITFPPPDGAPYTTAIPPTTGVLDVRLVDGPNGKHDVLEINLNQLEVSGGTRLKLAVAQMVFTATGLPEVHGVRFLLNGSPVAVPLDNGESETGAVVTRADFSQLNPTTTTTTAPEAAEPVPGELDGQPTEGT
jgi:hypothetical protein